MQTYLDNEGQPIGKTGVVAVFDLLGFKNFVAANDLLEQVSTLEGIVEGAIHSAVSGAEQMLSSDAPFQAPEAYRKRIEKINERQTVGRVLLTDMIALWVETWDDPLAVRTAWTKIIIASNILFGGLLVSGFPACGAVSCGSYHVKFNKMGGTLLGEAFLDGHLEAGRQNWIGCIFSPRAAEETGNISEFVQTKFLDLSYPWFQVPMKKGTPTEARRALDWSISYRKRPESRDILKALNLYCAMHNKIVDESALQKIKATAEYYLHLLNQSSNGR